MIKKTLIITSLFASALLWSVASNAQEQASQSRSKSLKLYTNFQYSDYTAITSQPTLFALQIEDSSNFNFGRISPAIAIETAKGNYHELELSMANINRSKNETTFGSNITSTNTAGEILWNFAISMRYEYILSFLGKDQKRKNNKFKPSLGFGLQPYFIHTEDQPLVATSYYNNATYFGTKLTITPRITYRLTDQWFLDFNIPFQIAEARASSSFVDNPLIREENRRISSFSFSGFPSIFECRLGLGVKLN